MGTLNISAGGLVTAGETYLGYSDGTRGTINVDGVGSKLDLQANGLYVGYQGQGSLSISGGGVVNAGYTRVGYTDDSAGGSVTISGAGSALDIGSARLDIGYYNSGSVTVANGGALTSGSSVIGAYYGNYGSTFNASVTVTGRNSTWTNSGDLYLGYQYAGTNGTLTIESGGSVTSTGWAFLGQFAGTHGTISVSGTGSSLTIGGSIAVGNLGDGTLIVSDGGTMQSGEGYIGADTTSHGTAMITGPGSTWSLGTALLYIGYGGSDGLLSVASGATVTAGQILKVSGAASAEVVLDGGTLRAGQGQSDFLSGFGASDITLAAGGGTIDTNGFSVGVSSVLGGTGGLTKVGQGTLTLAVNNTYAGLTTVSAGTLQLGDGGATGSVGGAIANSGTVVFDRSDNVTASGRSPARARWFRRVRGR